MYVGPLRDWRDSAAHAVPQLTEILRKPAGTQTLRPIQAVALLEAWNRRGLYLHARVGGGKTFVAGLLPTLMRSAGYQRPLIMTSGGGLRQLRADFDKAKDDWKICENYWPESYTKLARSESADLLHRLRPDLIICDEADALRNQKTAAAPKRIRRWLDEAPQTMCCFMSATFHKQKVTDFAHIMAWALGDDSPCPADPMIAELWSASIDEGDTIGLKELSKTFPRVSSHEDLKDQFARRINGTPGCIISDDKFTDSTLVIDIVHHDPGHETEFERLRNEGIRPDGWDVINERPRDDIPKPEGMAQAATVWSTARQLACDFYYTADPTPPLDWFNARRGWFSFVRKVIEAGYLDTEFQVRTACAASPVPEYSAWQEIKHTFKPNRVPVWLGRQSIDYAIQWGRRHPGVIWTDHVAWGQRLAAETGWVMYGESGLDAIGRSINDATPDQGPIIARRQANMRYRNLQAWHRNLIMAMPNSGLEFEQMIGRTHREGQKQPYVYAELYLACREHAVSLEKVLSSSEHSFATTKLSYKILDACLRTHNAQPLARAWA